MIYCVQQSKSFRCSHLHSWGSKWSVWGSGGHSELKLWPNLKLKYMKWRETQREAGLYFCCSCYMPEHRLGWLILLNESSCSDPALLSHFFLLSVLSQCTVTCGQGYQMRAVKCVVGTYVSVVDDNECNAATRPTDTQVNPALLSPSFASVCTEASRLHLEGMSCCS